MKAIILAAGKGERLKEITQKIPKPMIPYKGKPVLQYNIELCRKYGIEDVYINLHHLPEIITDYFEDGEKFGVNIKYSHEKELLGTSGAVKNIANKYWKLGKGYDQITPFFVIYGDQISDFNLASLKAKYEKEKCIGVIAFHYREDVIHSGVAEFNDDQRILRFIEKPKPGETDSHWVNAGVYYFNPQIIDFINDDFSDFGKQVFPDLIKNNHPLYGVCENKGVSVFDTPEMYKKTFMK